MGKLYSGMDIAFSFCDRMLVRCEMGNLCSSEDLSITNVGNKRSTKDEWNWIELNLDLIIICSVSVDLEMV